MVRIDENINFLSLLLDSRSLFFFLSNHELKNNKNKFYTKVKLQIEKILGDQIYIGCEVQEFK
jgi:hypothetical protein